MYGSLVPNPRLLLSGPRHPRLLLVPVSASDDGELRTAPQGSVDLDSLVEHASGSFWKRRHVAGKKKQDRRRGPEGSETEDRFREGRQKIWNETPPSPANIYFFTRHARGIILTRVEARRTPELSKRLTMMRMIKEPSPLRGRGLRREFRASCLVGSFSLIYSAAGQE